MQEGLALGNKAMGLTGKLLGPWFTRQQSDAESRASIQAVLANQVATHIELHPNDPVMMDAIAACNGRFGFNNLLQIVRLAIPQLKECARPDLLSDDWGANFREKARTYSDPDMAQLWAQLLAGEANNPGSYSRKTVNVLADMETKDARLFKSLCGYRLLPVNIMPESIPSAAPMFTRAPGPPCLAVLDDRHPIYTEKGITFNSLARLDWLGLIRYVSFGWVRSHGSDKFSVYEHGDGQLFLASDKPIEFGKAEYLPAGAELSELCVPLESPIGFVGYLTEVWRGKGVRVAGSLSEALSA